MSVDGWSNIRVRVDLLREVQAAAAADGMSATRWAELLFRRALNERPASSLQAARLADELGRHDPVVLAELARLLSAGRDAA